MTKEDGIPIFHKVFEGNIFDSKTLPAILRHLKRHEIKNVYMGGDRGVSSKLNIKEGKAKVLLILSITDNGGFKPYDKFLADATETVSKNNHGN